jgi:uncharacterized protein (DUF433 family)
MGRVAEAFAVAARDGGMMALMQPFPLNHGLDRYSQRMDERLLERITFDPAVCTGKPCIRGLRIRVCDVLDLLGSDLTIDQVLAAFPDLERDDILAALAYASRLTSHVAA